MYWNYHRWTYQHQCNCNCILPQSCLGSGTSHFYPKSYLLDLAALSIPTTSHWPWEYTNSLQTFTFTPFLPGSWYNTKLENALGVHDVDKNTRCPCSSGWAVSRPKVGKWVPPNFHNISSVETGKTISSIHCRMKEYISKICLWNTMLKQETDQLFSQTTLNSNQIKKNILKEFFLT